MSKGTARRLESVDCVRGLIIIFMAFDHVGALMIRRHSSEFWGGSWTYYEDPFSLQFLLRFLSHLCAPGFFLWMGFGIAKLLQARQLEGWSSNQICGFLVKRGLLLVAISQFVETPAWAIGFLSAAQEGVGISAPGSGGDIYINISVIFALGACMTIIGGLVPLLQRWPLICIALAILIAILCHLYTPDESQVDASFALWQRLLLVAGQTGPVVVVYPTLPWLAIAFFGVALGLSHSKLPTGFFSRITWLGISMIGIGVILRLSGDVGNLRLPRDGSVIEFLNVIKYPPSLVFCLWMVGANLLLLGVFHYFYEKTSQLFQVLITFGRAPLFFYIAHLYLYAILGAAFFRSGTSYLVGLSVGALGIVVLYFACLKYDHFKSSHPSTSFWRML